MSNLEPRLAWEQSLDRCLLNVPGASVRFERTEDRWTHHLELSGSLPGSHATVSAVECPPDHADPTRIVSPAFQELHRHELAEEGGRRLCVLLTGHLFQHHFSAAVTLTLGLDPNEDDSGQPRAVLEFDIADRCRQPVESLAATFLVRLGSGSLAGADAQAISWTLPEPGSRLTLQCDPPGTLALAEAGRQAARVQALARIEPAQFTHRLRYRWIWEICSDRTR